MQNRAGTIKVGFGEDDVGQVTEMRLDRWAVGHQSDSFSCIREILRAV